MYKVATQVKKGENVVVRDLRAPNLEELRSLLRRLLNLSNLESLSFFEVHETKGNQTTLVVGSLSQEWPKGAATETHKVIYSPRVPSSTRAAADTTPPPLGPEPKPTPLSIIEALGVKAKARKAQSTPTIDEKFRPLRIHKREVA
jgi:hypothetical protein